MTKTITKADAVAAIKDMFDIKEGGQSMVYEEGGVTKFLIFKGEYDRGTVIRRLVSYFNSGVVIEGGQVRIEPITLVFTEVIVEDRKLKNYNYV